MHQLTSYLVARMPEGMNYSEAVQLCLRLYCTVDGVPKILLPLTKETLADAFSQLGRAGWVQGGNVDEVTAPGHWLAVMGTIFKGGADVADLERGEKMACQVGFVTEAKIS